MKDNYEERKQNRLQYVKAKAQQHEAAAKAHLDHANVLIHQLIPGQPVLLDHYSAPRALRFLEKIDKAFDKSIAAAKEASYYHDKARAIENNAAISSDDPQALQKLNDQLADLESRHQFMKEANRCIRNDDKAAFLALDYPMANPTHWLELHQPDYLGRTGYAAFELQNSSANISRVKKRIQQLEKAAQRPASEETVGSVRLMQNTQVNRVQLFFPGKPSEQIRAGLKQKGFHPYHSPDGWCWQRKLSGNAVEIARELLTRLSTEGSE